MEIQEKNRRGIPLWNIAPDHEPEMERFRTFTITSKIVTGKYRFSVRTDQESVHPVIVFHKPDKIGNSLAFIAVIRDQHGNLSGDRISVPVIGGDQLQLFFINLPVISKHKADPKPILCHLNGNIKVGNLLFLSWGLLPN